MARTFCSGHIAWQAAQPAPIGIADQWALELRKVHCYESKEEEHPMKYRLTALAMLLAIASALVVAPFGAAAQTKDKNFLKNIPVSGALADGGTFKGKVTITEFGYDEVTGLWVSGFLHGTATTVDGTSYEDVEQHFSQVDATLNEGGVAAAGLVQQQATCDILNLDIGAIHLDLLGLVVDLSPISLDITAVSGPGNLLGNLLCAVAGLLDPSGFLDELIGTLEDLLDLLNQINDLI